MKTRLVQVDKMKIGANLLLSLIPFLLIGCDFSDDKLIVRNDSETSIAFIIPAEPNYFPTSKDEQATELNNQVNDSLMNIVAKYDPNVDDFGGVHFLANNSERRVYTFNTKWEEIIDSTPDKKLKVMFIPASAMTSGQYKWKDLYEQKMFKEMSFTESELEKMDWTIIYKEVQ